jgi:serine/threonine protein kinase
MIDSTGCLKIGVVMMVIMMNPHDRHACESILHLSFIISSGDFGLSLLSEPAAEKGQMQGATGTLEYMAPEVLQGLPYDPQPADIWSIGVILYCMLSGSFPFPDKRAIIAVDFEMPAYFTVPMRSLISSILQRDPRRRPSIDTIRDSELMRHVTPTASLLEQFYSALKLKRENEEAGLLQSPVQRFRRASLSVVFTRKVTTALSSPTLHGAGRDVRMVCHDRLMSLMELLLGEFVKYWTHLVA